MCFTKNVVVIQKIKMAIKGVAMKAEAAGAKIVTGVEVTGFQKR